MPHPFFGAKDVCYIEKKVAKKKAFLGQASLYMYLHLHLMGTFFLSRYSTLVWPWPVITVTHRCERCGAV